MTFQMSFTNLLLSLLIYSSSEVIGAYEIDPKGYVVYCPCMGRFGNQVEQLLGSISFARALNRTLVLPPFIEYIRGQPKKMVDYDEYFQVEPFKQDSLRVILMRDFIQQIAPRIWPLNRRKVFCWSAHPSIYNKSLPSSCHAKEGNPFGPFWDYSGIDFIGDIYYGEEINEGFNL
ncbi:unnamed protein product, partial [Anisakis simplex]|uniref:GDP-fucose protein O-fucosyltransferase 1 n=1 Tax=Anisakis simplex TaxID=6269 RepID=A0A0M3JA70_ANISI